MPCLNAELRLMDEKYLMSNKGTAMGSNLSRHEMYCSENYMEFYFKFNCRSTRSNPEINARNSAACFGEN